MKQIVILSGKGGTGKTTVASTIAHLASREFKITMADADVDAANLELVLSPKMLESHEFIGEKVAVIDQQNCLGCGACEAACRFGAIVPNGGEFRTDPFAIDPGACEGCAACLYRCPTAAIRMDDRIAGRWFVSETRFGPLVHAHLFAGQENSGKLVAVVKQRARDLAIEQRSDYMIVDGPPGIGCAVIAASSGADLALLVVEPTMAGVHDLKRVLATTRHFRIPAAVIVNKWDLNPTRAEEIDRFCESQAVHVIGRLPFDTAATKAMVAGRVITEQPAGRLAQRLERAWRRLFSEVNA